MRLLLATANSGKVREFRRALRGLGLELITASDWGAIPTPEETGDSFAANARIKARHYAAHSGLTALSDDSGLMVDALGGQPGVHSARFAPDTPSRIAKLLRAMNDIPAEDFEARRARFVCALCLFGPDGTIEVEGSVTGVITTAPRGKGGFGYDPVFYYPPVEKTFAELSTAEKNRVSHRAQALAQLRERLRGI